MRTPQVDRLPRRSRGRSITLHVDGLPIESFAGETVATALLAARGWICRDAVRARGIFCGIGVCFECVVSIDDVSAARACMTLACDGMRVGTIVEGSAGA